MQLVDIVSVEGHPGLKLALWINMLYGENTYQDFPGTVEVGEARFALLPKRVDRRAIEKSNGSPMTLEVGHIGVGLFKPVRRGYQAMLDSVGYQHELFAMVKYSEIVESNRGNGLGSAMYVTVTRELGALVADTTWSEGAEGMWSKLHTRHKCVDVVTWDYLFQIPMAIWTCKKTRQNKFWKKVLDE